MITGIILASGFSKRMKKDKLLLKVDGISVIEKVVKECKDSLLDETILIYREEKVALIGKKYNITTIYNQNAYLGQSASVKLGIKRSKYTDAYMFIMGDQPFVKSHFINKLIDDYNQSNSEILIPCFNGRNGTPTIFSSKYKEELLKIQGDKGGRDIIKENFSDVTMVNIDDRMLGLDIDTIVDYKSILG